ncbi:MAG: SIMPL domain-containing protein [Marinifilaceae bacterium]
MKWTTAIGLILGSLILGLFFSSSVKVFVDKDRAVYVKGLAEMEVEANQVIWPIPFKETGNNLEQIYTSIENSRKQVIAFLMENGIKKEEISMNAPDIYDSQADRYANQNVKFRYIASSVITVNSSNVELVRKLIDRQVELLKNGVIISGDSYQNQVQYFYTDLNKIKPQMIEQATQNARQAALKFAEDSQSKLGKIRTATQGLFSIDNRDSNTPYIKKVRVVTSITYRLKD